MGFVALGGGCTSAGAGCTSADGSGILLPRGFGVHVCSSVTGDKTGYIGSHRDRATAVVRDPRHPTQVYTSSLDGTVKLWDTSDGELVSTIRVGEPVYSLACPKGSKVLYLTCHRQEAKSGKVRRIDLSSGKVTQDIFKVSAAPILEVSLTGALVATTNRNTLFVWRTSTTLNEALPLHHTKKLTCCALAPSGDQVAAGDVTGRILMWRGLDSALSQPRSRSEALTALTTMHWHSAAVNCIAFSSDGRYMLSGGSEAVLVIWQLHSGQRTYLPRLGSALMTISSTPDPSTFLVSQADNCARLINTSAMKVECSVYGVLPPPRSADAEGATSAAPAIHPGSGHLVLPAENCILQFYDVVHDKHVSCLQIAARNPVSWSSLREDAAGDESTKLPEEPRVTSFSFSCEGDWLVTAELRPHVGEGNSTECSLKFWEQSGRQAGAMQSYELNTRADSPHTARVSCLAYHPANHLVVSGSADGQFKIWSIQRMPLAPGHSSQWGWRCRSTASLAQPGVARQDEALQAAAFSHDGSLLALGCGDKVSIWEPESNALISHLPKPSGSGKANFSKLCFLSGTPYLVGTSQGPDASLVVWNLVTASVWWSYKLSVSHVTADPASGRFAVALPALQVAADDHSSSPRSAHILLFDGSSSKPIAAWRLVKTEARALMFVRSGSSLAGQFAAVEGAAPLVLVTGDHQFTVLAPKLPDQAAGLGPLASEPPANSVGASSLALEALFGKAQGQGAAAREEEATVDPLKTILPSEWLQLLDTPSHALPSVVDLCSAVLEKMVGAQLDP
mmetsp:Transcript_23554/g.65323  ORF Transcript_23554/g.65323 Transcript_23554/m.65323 type:complete len:792 (+) Transcript_23554:137-2512(+)